MTSAGGSTVTMPAHFKADSEEGAAGNATAAREGCTGMGCWTPAGFQSFMSSSSKRLSSAAVIHCEATVDTGALVHAAPDDPTDTSSSGPTGVTTGTGPAVTVGSGLRGAMPGRESSDSVAASGYCIHSGSVSVSDHDIVRTAIRATPKTTRRDDSWKRAKLSKTEQRLNQSDCSTTLFLLKPGYICSFPTLTSRSHHAAPDGILGATIVF